MVEVWQEGQWLVNSYIYLFICRLFKYAVSSSGIVSNVRIIHEKGIGGIIQHLLCVIE
jgi:hypothetical protein